jgi:hypothetical protein
MRERLRRFAVVGLVATAVDVLLLVGLRRAGCTLVVADLAALAAAALVARPMHRLVTLRDDPFARWIRSPGLFISVVLAAGSVSREMLKRQKQERAQRLESEILEQVAPFLETSGLSIETGPDGARALAVEVHTDITDEAFLAALESGLPDCAGNALCVHVMRDPLIP